MAKDDLVRIKHMLESAKEAVSFARNRRRRDLDNNRMLTLSIVKSIEIVGEAASKVSRKIRNKYPEIPWANIIGMRNRLIHGYFGIDLERVWGTVKEDLPSLISKLERIISSEEVLEDFSH
jgi:uncharacterized protein with HEPN domain